MARLRGPIHFTGSLDGLSAYTMEGTEGIILRRKTGPTSKQFKTSRSYSIPRKNATEFGGCGRAAGLLMEAFHPLKPLPLHGTPGRLSAVLKRVQVAETDSALGRRCIRLSLAPQFWAGVGLNKGEYMDAVVRAPLTATIVRETRQATVEVPALTPGVNFFAPTGLPFYRVSATLGVMPDLVYDDLRKGFFPEEDAPRVHAVLASTDWRPVKSKTAAATTLELSLPPLAGSEAFSLLVCVAVHFGTVGSLGEVVAVKKWGRAKVLEVG